MSSLIDSPREHIPDVPAVYFVYPTEENLLNICRDFECAKYENYYLNFISPISRVSLETLAQTALSQECVQQITKVFDQYTNFVCLEDDLFILRPPSIEIPTYYALNRTKTTDKDIEAIVETAVEGLFSVFATLGTLPIIRCPRGDASERIATQLERRIRDCLQDTRKTLFVGSDSTTRGFYNGSTGDHRGLSSSMSGTNVNRLPPNLFQRPLLILLDRNLDPATPLHHDFTYQSLVHDLFTIRLNRVEADLSLAILTDDINAKNGSKSTESQGKTSKNLKSGKLEQYDLSTDTDHLWRDFKNLSFSCVTNAIQDEVEVLRDNEKRLNELKSTMSLTPDVPLLADSSVTVLDDNTTHLKNAINSLPQLMEQKRCVDMHTKIASCVANVISKRGLIALMDEESKLLSRQMKSMQEVGTAEDKLRLVLLAALLREDSSTILSSVGTGTSNVSGAGSGSSGGSDFVFSSEQVNQMMSALKEIYPDLDTSSIAYVQKQLRFGLNQDECATSRGNRPQNTFGRLLYHGSAMFQTGMQNLMGRKTYLPFTRIVSQLMDNKGGSEVDEYYYLDPKWQRRYNAEMPRINEPFCEAYVFVVGGGSYVEYQNLLEWGRTTSTSTTSALSHSRSSSALIAPPTQSLGSGWSSGSAVTRRVSYGCTELVSPREYLQQLASLGQEI